MPFFDAYEYATKAMDFEDYTRYQPYVKDDPDIYNKLKAAYEAKDAAGFNQLYSYVTVRNVLSEMEEKDVDMKAYIEKMNKRYGEMPEVKQAISDWLNEPRVDYTWTYNGQVRSILYNRANYNVEGIEAGGTYWDGVTAQVAMTADIVDGKLVVSNELPVAETGTTTTALVGTITTAIAAVASMSMFAKEIRGEFYELSKDVWGEDLYQFDPDWWDSYYAGDKLTGFRAFIAENLLAIDPATDEISLYIDDTFVASVARYAYKKGWFSLSSDIYRVPGTSLDLTKLNYPIHAFEIVETLHKYETGTVIKIPNVQTTRYNNLGTGKFIVVDEFNYGSTVHDYILVYASKISDEKLAISGDTYTYEGTQFSPVYENHFTYNDAPTAKYEIEGKPVYITKVGFIASANEGNSFYDYANDWSTLYSTDVRPAWEIDKVNRVAAAAYIALYGDEDEGLTIRGMYEQGDAKRFAIAQANADLTIDDMKALLRTTYPKVWASSILQGIPQPDGTINKKTYIKVPIPTGTDITSRNPTTGTGTQNKTTVSVSDLPRDSQIALPNTAVRPNGATDNPGRDDTGSAPEAPLPVGTASSMWAIYNPTQDIIDRFGAWMWSNNIFEQIKKLFSDPMQAIIGIHKVFGRPAIGGVKTIKVGYLDTEIASNYVSNQYTTVDCGTVRLNEYFKSVYDYAPYTSVNLYLPFVGIVQLDVADVMRSSINVTYGIDVLTGDCLAKVSVERDGAGGILYSYPGNCAVKYPVSSGSYLGIIGLAAGAIGAAATGNMGLLAAGASGGFTKVQHGGSFVGNSGATGPKTPYLIITRPQPAYAASFNAYEGYPINSTLQIGSCKGFIRVKECHLSNINATDDELDMIDQILKDGIIVQS